MNVPDLLFIPPSASDIGMNASSSPLTPTPYCNYSHMYGGGGAADDHSVILRRDSCHYHQPYCPSELFIGK